MGGNPKPLTVIYSPTALRDLDEIWEWNSHQYGPNRANGYIRFLTDQISKISENSDLGRPVNTRPDLRFLTMKIRPRGHGHVAVFRVDNSLETVVIAHIFHTRQNWEDSIFERPGS